MGIGSIITELRGHGYWVPQGRQSVKNALNFCTKCKRYNSRPVLPSNMANLPTSGVKFEVSYGNTGVDFTGHFWAKEGNM